MESQKATEIKSKTRLKIIILLPMLYFAYRFGRNVIETIVSSSSFSVSVFISAVLSLIMAFVCSYVAVYAIKRLFDKRASLVLNENGIEDRSGMVSAGFISWPEVTEITSSKIPFSDVITVKLRHPSWPLRNQRNLFKRLWLTMENRYFGSPVNIAAGHLKIKSRELQSVVNQHFLSSQVESRTIELKHEKDVIQREKMELINSINYAKRIQTALLPSYATIQKQVGESFILFLPKDIVSGDFFWIENVNEWVFFAVCDCTGHGVPGALLSIVCYNALSRAVKEYGIIQPSKILDKVAELIVESVGLEGEVKDGMDASLCAFNKNTRQLFWSGANIPLWIAREDAVYELLEFRPDKQPIGLVENRFPYTNHTIEIRKGDILYLFSDGYADQFGGALGKKLTRKKFKEILMLQRGHSLSAQQEYLLKFHSDYRKNTDQVDDILVAGIRVER